MKDHRSYIRNLSSCESWAWKKFRLERDLNPWSLRYRCSALTNWAIKPTGSWSFSEFFIYPLRWWNDSEYMKIHIFELRKKQWISERSSQLYLWDGTYGFIVLFRDQTVCRCHYKGSTFSYLRTLSVGPAGVRPTTSRTVVRYSTNWANRSAVRPCRF